MIILSPISERHGKDKAITTSKIFNPELEELLAQGKKTEIEIALEDAKHYKNHLAKGWGTEGDWKGSSLAIRELIDKSGSISKEEALMAISARAQAAVEEKKNKYNA